MAIDWVDQGLRIADALLVGIVVKTCIPTPGWMDKQKVASQEASGNGGIAYIPAAPGRMLSRGLPIAQIALGSSLALYDYRRFPVVSKLFVVNFDMDILMILSGVAAFFIFAFLNLSRIIMAQSVSKHTNPKS